MTGSLVDGHPSLFAPATEWTKYLHSLEQRPDRETNLGVQAAIRQAKRVIADDARANASTT